MGPARVQGFRLRAVLAAVRAGGKQKAQALLDLLAENPYQQPPDYKLWWQTFAEPVPAESTFNIDWSSRCRS
jgi:hypothetical protein